MPPTNNPAYVRSRRMQEQSWLLDAAIRVIGVDWDQGRTRSALSACGGLDAAGDFQRVRDRIKKFIDIHREFAQAGERRERLAKQARSRGHLVEAREHAFVASLLYGNAEWPLFGDSPLAQEYSDRKIACFEQYREHAPYPIRRVDIPYGDSALPGYLHLPREGAGPFPCLLAIGGMDGFKEKRVAMYGDKFLERGIAQLVVELPGQGEALARGLVITENSTVEAGRAIRAWMGEQPDIDPNKLAITGSSFGSYWATQIAATADGLLGCGVTGVVHEPGLRSIFELASPTFKSRFMHMAGYTDEESFDRFAATFDVRPFAEQLSCPYLVVAGEDDELSPIEHTFEMVSRIKAPVRMVLFEGEKHSVGGGSASALGPNRTHLVAEWFVDRFAGRPAEDRYEHVGSKGQVHERPALWRN
jgi:dienelactone hydrolase